MTTMVDSFKKLRRDADKAGRVAMYQKGEELSAPCYSTTCPTGLDEWTCPACGDHLKRDDSRGTAFRPCQCVSDAYGAGKMDFLEQQRPGVVEAELTRAGIDGILLGCTFASFIPREGTEEALRTCQRYARSFDLGQPQGLFLFGDPGAGKTHIACAVVRAILEEADITPLFVEAVHFLREARSHQAGTEHPVDKCIKAPLLVFDDIGNAYNSAFAQEQLYAVVAGRYKAGRPTVITANGDADDLKKTLGAPLVSRLFQMCAPVQLMADDYRSTQIPTVE